MPVLASFTFGDALLTVLEFAVLFFWIWIAITVIIDVFRSHDLSGWGKAGWLLLIVIFPLFGVLIYLIARGSDMHQRAARAASEQDAAAREYILEAASTPGDDLAKLEDLKTRGVITDEQFEHAKQKALG
jgi:ABC-type multidrug transport system fused ATPase/permease subunit